MHSLYNVESAAAFDFLPHSSIFNHNAAIRWVTAGAGGSVASVNQEAVAIRARLAADRRESITVLHVVKHDFLRKLPFSPGAGSAVLAALGVWIVAALNARMRGKGVLGALLFYLASP